jgi:ribonuclease HI
MAMSSTPAAGSSQDHMAATLRADLEESLKAMERPGSRTVEDRDVAEVVELELRLLSGEVRRDRAAVSRLLHPDFVEFGASGRVWDAASALRALADDAGERTEVFDLAAQRLALDVVLVTYRADRAGRSSLRASVWVRDASGWRVRFHQGTSRPGCGAP